MSLVIPECSCSADVEAGSVDVVSEHMHVVSVEQLMSAFTNVWSNGCDSEGMAAADEALVKLHTCLA